jgi:hypothetical protein
MYVLLFVLRVKSYLNYDCQVNKIPSDINFPLYNIGIILC